MGPESPARPADWAALLRDRSRHAPDARAFAFVSDGGERAVLTYGELNERSLSFATALRSIESTGPVLLLYPPGIDYLVALFACLRSGVVPVPAYPPTAHAASWERLATLAADSTATTALVPAGTRERFLRRAAGRPAASLLLPETDGWQHKPADHGVDVPAKQADLALLQYTSGSTSAPRGVRLSHGNLWHNCEVIASAFGTSGQTMGVSWLPLHHDMGLIGGVLQIVYCGGSCELMSPASFAGDPLRWLRMISEAGADVSGGPNFAYDLCVRQLARAGDVELDLRSWRVAFNGSEPVRADTLERFATAFGPYGFRAEAFTPCYGLAESALMVTCKPAGTAPALVPAPADSSTPGLLVSSGVAPLGDRVAIVDPAARVAVPEGEVGEVWVSSASVSAGYWRSDAGEFAATLAGDPATTFLRTGDLGFRHDGQLVVTGRLKDLIIIRGRNHYPQDIERTAELAQSRLRPHGSAAFAVPGEGGERLVTVHEVDRHTAEAELAELAVAVRVAVGDQHGVSPDEVVFLRAGLLPRTTSGKVRRSACRQQWLDGTLPALGTSSRVIEVQDDSTQDPTVLAMREHVADALGVPACLVSLGSPLVAQGLDSLGALRLQHRLTALGVRAGVAGVLGSTVPDLATMVGEAPQEQAARPDDEPGDLPLSGSQRALWFWHLFAPDSDAYLVSGAAHVRAELDPERLRQALAAVVDRHEALRTTFPGGEQPVQRVHARLAPEFRVIDCADTDDADTTALIRAAASRPMDVEHGPLVRLNVLTRSATDHHVVLCVHHLVTDLWSMALLAQDIGRYYRDGADANEPAPLGYRTFARRQAERETGTEGARHWEFWQRRLADAPAALALPGAGQRPRASRLRGGAVPVELDHELSGRLRALAEHAGTTPFAVLLTGFLLLLHRYTGARDLIVGTPWHGRTDADSANTIGCFVNTVPLRALLDPAQSCLALIERVHRESREAFEHGEFPFATLVQRLRPPRETGRSPLLHALFSLHQAPGPDGSALLPFALGRDGESLSIGGLPFAPTPMPPQDAQADLALTMGELADGRFAGQLRHDADLLSEPLALRLVPYLRTVFAALAADPRQPVGRIPLADPAELARLHDLINPPRPAIDPGRSVPDRIAARIRLHPEWPAIDAGRPLTYGELGASADALSARLRARGVRTGTVVAVHLPRGADLIVALLAVLRAGAAYLPVDPELPPARVEFILADARPAAVITTPSGRPPCLPGTPVLSVDADPATEAPSFAPAVVDLGDPAYVIYTSGSTGRPKGVVVPHGALANFTTAMVADHAIDATTRWLAITTVSFDIAVLELLVPLTVGGVVRLVDHAGDGVTLREILARERVTHLQATPGTWQLLVDAAWPGNSGLRALCGGEALPAGLAGEVARRVASLTNMYGPTETTVWSTCAQVHSGDSAVLIGRPIANTRVGVLDAAGEPVPPDVAGELFIGGLGVADGYLNRPGLTAERFVPDPDGAGTRRYRTGDLVRYRPDGQLSFVGRADHQLKVRGHRVEPGEVESVVDGHPAVGRSAVVLWRDTLVAYLRPAEATLPDSEQEPRLSAAILDHARAALPAYLVPSRLIWLADLPTTPNGKIDRAKLPEPAPVAVDRSGGAARSATERTVADLIARLLEVPSIGRTDNLFELGVHSLLLSRFQAEIRAVFGVELPLRRLFDEPTVAAIAAMVEAMETAPAGPTVRPANRNRFLAGSSAGGALTLPAALRTRSEQP